MGKKLIHLSALLFFVAMNQACGSYDLKQSESSQLNSLSAKEYGALESCPTQDFSPEKIEIGTDDSSAEFVDNNRTIKDLGTKLVNTRFFRTPDTLFRFMKLVYESISGEIAKYLAKNNMDPEAAQLLFKGGNVLRTVYHEFLEMVPAQARSIISGFYKDFFKRSDADFSVYVDEKRLGGRPYEKIMDELANLVYKQLGVLRNEFKWNRDKYFNFMQLNVDYASDVLEDFLDELVDSGITNDVYNDVWFGSEFLQMQLLGASAGATGKCPYVGNYDWQYKFDANKNIVGKKLTTKPDWIVNTDNRALEFKKDPKSDDIIKFYLVRSKVYPKYTFKTFNGDLVSRTIGGELIDVSFPHRDESSLREFLDNFSKLTKTYTFTNADGEILKMKAYSRAGLVEDLEKILFSISRPWDGGPKYGKRINRTFLLLHLEMIGEYGLGSTRVEKYLANLNNKILEPLANLFKDGKPQLELAQQIIRNAKLIENPDIPEQSGFWNQVAKLALRIAEDPEENDEEEFKKFFKVITDNMDIVYQLSQLPRAEPINADDVYNANLKSLH